MCPRRCCSLTTGRAAVTGVTTAMDMDGVAVNTVFMIAAIGAITAARMAVFAAADVATGTAGIDRSG